jgi:ribosomal-protein-alanine N-acetyltransferase
VIGFAAGSFLEGDDAALLENLTVDVAWRRKGVARALCAALMDWAKSEGAWELDLEVRVTNEAARALYVSLQFVEQGRRKKYYSDPEEDGVMMRLRFR